MDGTLEGSSHDWMIGLSHPVGITADLGLQDGLQFPMYPPCFEIGRCERSPCGKGLIKWLIHINPIPLVNFNKATRWNHKYPRLKTIQYHNPLCLQICAAVRFCLSLGKNRSCSKKPFPQTWFNWKRFKGFNPPTSISNIRKSSHWFMMSWPGMRSWPLWKPLHYLVWSLADSFMRGWHRCSSMEWRQRSCSYCRRAWMCLGVGSRSPTRWGSAKWVSWFIPWTLTRTELRYPETLPVHHITSTRTQWAQMKERKKVPQIFKASVIPIWLFNRLPWKITIFNR
jgi:glutaredoxin